MERSSERGSFDELVAGISAEERKFLLAKLNQNREKELPLLQPMREEIDNFTPNQLIDLAMKELEEWANNLPENYYAINYNIKTECSIL